MLTSIILVYMHYTMQVTGFIILKMLCRCPSGILILQFLLEISLVGSFSSSKALKPLVRQCCDLGADVNACTLSLGAPTSLLQAKVEVAHIMCGP